MLILNMTLNFTSICNPKLLQVWQSKQSPLFMFSLIIIWEFKGVMFDFILLGSFDIMPNG